MRLIPVLALIIAVTAMLPAAVQLQLRSEARVYQQQIRLCDVVSWDSSVRLPLANLVLGYCDLKAGRQDFSRAEIAEKLRGNGFNDFSLAGSEAVRVLFAGVRVTAESLVEELRRYISRNSGWGNDFRIQLASLKELYRPPDAELALEPLSGQDFLGTMRFRLFCLRGGERLFEELLTVQISVERVVAVSNAFLKRGEPVEADDVRWEKRELTKYHKNAYFTPAELLGKKLVRAVSANSMLVREMIESARDVKRGFPATLRYASQGLLITVPVKVLMDGERGDLVRVLNLSSKEVVAARVVGKNLLEVAE